MNYKILQKKIVAIIAIDNSDIEHKLQQICDVLYKEIPHYDWVGFYFANHDTKTLHLGPYSGEKTEHITIPFGKGICGQVAVTNQNFIVDDVTSQNNYIACSIQVKSEIVIPIFVDGKNIGQIDIDSNTINAFTKEDETFLEFVAIKVASMLK